MVLCVPERIGEETLTMYEKLVKQCRDCLDSLCGECEYEHLQKPGNFVPCMNALLRETADAIEELSDRNVGKWIPVTERLPKICERDINGNITFSGRVWSCTDFGNGFYWQQTDQYTTNCGGKWLSEVPEDDGFTPKVVAWMPLPEPPEERES